MDITTIIRKFHIHREFFILSIVLLLLLIAILRPAFPIKQNIHSYLLVVDITQSMNAADMSLDGKPATRIAFTKQLLRETISTLPCDTKIGIGMFSGVNVVALYTPIELCANFSSIQDTIDHIDWRSAWTADSRVRESMLASAQLVNNFSEPAQVVFFSDGEEAPKLHDFNTRDLTTLQGADGWLLVGIGTDKGAAIPRLDRSNQLTGYWSHESMQLAPGAAPIAAAGLLQRKSDIAEGVHDRYISKLAESHLQKISQELGASYIHATDSHALVSAMRNLKPARREWATVHIDWILAILAGTCLLTAYIPHHPFRKWQQRRKNQLESAQTLYEMDSTSVLP